MSLFYLMFDNYVIPIFALPCIYFNSSTEPFLLNTKVYLWLAASLMFSLSLSCNIILQFPQEAEWGWEFIQSVCMS